MNPIANMWEDVTWTMPETNNLQELHQSPSEAWQNVLIHSLTDLVKSIPWQLETLLQSIYKLN